MEAMRGGRVSMKAPVLGVVVVSVVLCTVRAGDDFKVYTLTAPAPEEVVGMLKGMCGPEARLVYDSRGRRLMVYGSSNDHERISQALLKINLPLKNLRIDVVTTEAVSEKKAGAGVSGSGNLVLGSGGTRGSVRLTPRIENTSVSAESSTRQTIMVQSGSESVLFVGSDVPNLEWLMDYGVRSGCAARGLAWQRVGAYLRVRATVLGDGSTVALEIVPELSGPVDGRTEHVRFAKVATEVTVKNGQTVELGGLAENKDFYSRFLIGVDKSGVSRQLRMSATPRILE